MKKQSGKVAGQRPAAFTTMPTGGKIPSSWIKMDAESHQTRSMYDSPSSKEVFTMAQITYDDFAKVVIRVGKIVRLEDFPKAIKPAYKLWIDFGSLGIKKSSAQITKLYLKEELVGRLVLAVTNFPPRQIADFISEVLVLGVVLENDEVVLVQPDRDVAPGNRIL